MENNKSKMELMRDRFNPGKITNNETKVILESALRESEMRAENILKAVSIDSKKRGRKITLNPEEKRDIPVTFKTSKMRLERLEKVLNSMNELRKEDFGIANMSMSELIDGLLFTHPKVKKILGEIV